MWVDQYEQQWTKRRTLRHALWSRHTQTEIRFPITIATIFISRLMIRLFEIQTELQNKPYNSVYNIWSIQYRKLSTGPNLRLLPLFVYYRPLLLVNVWSVRQCWMHINSNFGPRGKHVLHVSWRQVVYFKLLFWQLLRNKSSITGFWFNRGSLNKFRVKRLILGILGS